MDPNLYGNAGNTNINSYLGLFTNSNNTRTAKNSAYDLAGYGVQGVNSRQAEYQKSGKNSAYGYADGLDSNDSRRYTTSKAKSLGAIALSALSRILDSHSPSREMMKIGEYSGLGFALGLGNMVQPVKSKAEKVGQSALDGMREALTSLSDMADADMITDPMIRPVLDLTNIQNGIGTMNSMFDSPMVGLKASLDGTGDTIKDLYRAASTMNIGGSNNDGVVSEMVALRNDVKNLGQAMSQMRMYMDGREVGGIVSNEVDRRLGIRYLRNRREGRA